MTLAPRKASISGEMVPVAAKQLVWSRDSADLRATFFSPPPNRPRSAEWDGPQLVLRGEENLNKTCGE